MTALPSCSPPRILIVYKGNRTEMVRNKEQGDMQRI